MQNGTPTPMINETMFTTTDSANNSVVSMRVPRHCRRHAIGSALAVIALTTIGHAEDQRAEWNKPQAPLRVFGNTYYVGPRGLSSILITSEAGHVLIDGALPESAAMIASHVRQLGFRMEDVRVILNSHAHFDHAGGIAELQRLSDARVVATAWSARVFEWSNGTLHFPWNFSSSWERTMSAMTRSVGTVTKSAWPWRCT